jgi:hypothetical protein
VKIFRSRFLNLSRQGLASVILAACLSTAAAVGSPAGTHVPGQDEPAPDEDSPQAQPRGDGVLDLPDLDTAPTGPGSDSAPSGTDSDLGIPATALEAYKRAAEAVRAAAPECNLEWELIAAIGRIESVHASGYGLREDGYTDQPIRGPRLDGVQFALIRDTDNGKWDGDTEYDRAVGPTQFIPSSWKGWGADGNGDGKRDPNNIYDAALATGLYLCAGDRDLTQADDLKAAILSYNHSTEYYENVLAWLRRYKDGEVSEVPDSGTGPGTPTIPTTPGTPTSPSTPTPSEPAKPGKPTEPSTPSPRPPTPTPPPTDPETPKPVPVSKLTRVGKASFAADAGTTFEDRAQVMAVRANGKAAAGQKIRFTIVGDTDARFPDGTHTATATTNANGLATAPRITAGDRASEFTVRARLVSPSTEDVAPVSFAGTVRPAADALVRTSDEALEAPVSSTFGDDIGIKTTLNGKAAAGVELTAKIIVKDDDLANDAEQAAAGPYFKGPDDKPVRTLTLDPTDAEGLITLPELFTDDKAGTYQLVLTAPNGTTLTIDLTVTEASASPGLIPNPSPSPSAAG